jgi:hypothetical protein
MNPLYSKMIGSLIRALLATAGGSMLDDDTVEQVVGAVMLLASVGWSVYNHKAQEAAKKQEAFNRVVAIVPKSDRRPVGKASH